MSLQHFLKTTFEALQVLETQPEDKRIAMQLPCFFSFPPYPRIETVDLVGKIIEHFRALHEASVALIPHVLTFFSMTALPMLLLAVYAAVTNSAALTYYLACWFIVSLAKTGTNRIEASFAFFGKVQHRLAAVRRT